MSPTRRRCLLAIQPSPFTSPRSFRDASMPPTDRLSRLSANSKPASLTARSAERWRRWRKLLRATEIQLDGDLRQCGDAYRTSHLANRSPFCQETEFRQAGKNRLPAPTVSGTSTPRLVLLRQPSQQPLAKRLIKPSFAGLFILQGLLASLEAQLDRTRGRQDRIARIWPNRLILIPPNRR